MMEISTFNTRKFVRRMEAAGVSIVQAEAQAEVLIEAFNVNMESLVTKEFLESRLQVRFGEQQAYMDRRFAEQGARIDSNHRVFVWSQAIILAAVILPYLERLMAI